MAYQVTLGLVLTRVRQIANVENISQFVTEAELTDMFNQSYAEWYDMVRLSTFGGQYYRSVYTITTVGQQAAYPLPTDFLALISVDCFLVPGGTATSTNSMVRSAKPFQEEQRNMFRYWPVGGWTTDSPIYYQLQGPNIVFIPFPQSAFQVNLNYVPCSAKLVSADGDSFDSIGGWDMWIVYDMAIKILQKGNKAERIAQLQPYMTRQELRIKAAAPQRDMYGAEVVHEMAGNADGYDF